MKKLAAFISIGFLGLAATALANEVHLENADQQKEISVVYKLVYKNPGQPVFSRNIVTANLGEQDINIPTVRGFEQSGIVVLSVNGKELPDELTQFGKGHGCYAVTNSVNTRASLLIRFQTRANHGTVNCISH